MESARGGVDVLNFALRATGPVDAMFQYMADRTHEAASSSNWRDLFGAVRNAFTPTPPEDEDHDRAQELFAPLREVTAAITDVLTGDNHIATAQRYARDTRALLADGRAQEAEARISRMQLALDAMRRLG